MHPMYTSARVICGKVQIIDSNSWIQQGNDLSSYAHFPRTQTHTQISSIIQRADRPDRQFYPQKRDKYPSTSKQYTIPIQSCQRSPVILIEQGDKTHSVPNHNF